MKKEDHSQEKSPSVRSHIELWKEIGMSLTLPFIKESGEDKADQLSDNASQNKVHNIFFS